MIGRLGLGHEHVRQCAWVAAKIPAHLRKPGLTWSHHRLVARLPHDRQDELLKLAEDTGLRVRELKRFAEGGMPEADERQHSKVQFLLLQLGRDLGYEVWVARSDRSRGWSGTKFGTLGLLKELPRDLHEPAQKVIEQIDVLWVDGRSIIAAFEVEHTTPVYSGLLRMCDLLALEPYLRVDLFVVAPEERRDAVIFQTNRPAFSGLKLPKKCRLITFERLADVTGRLGDLAVHMKGSLLESISDSCELQAGDTSTPGED